MKLYKTHTSALTILCTNLVTAFKERPQRLRKNPSKSDELGQRI